MSQRINRDGQSVVVYFFDLIKERERERETTELRKSFTRIKALHRFPFFRVDIFHKEIEHNDTTTNHPPSKEISFM